MILAPNIIKIYKMSIIIEIPKISTYLCLITFNSKKCIGNSQFAELFPNYYKLTKKNHFLCNNCTLGNQLIKVDTTS